MPSDLLSKFRFWVEGFLGSRVNSFRFLRQHGNVRVKTYVMHDPRICLVCLQVARTELKHGEVHVEWMLRPSSHGGVSNFSASLLRKQYLLRKFSICASSKT